MHHLLAPIALMALLAGCAAAPSAPPAVQPSLAALEALGIGCDAGVEDNVPSGLVQWTCTGSLEGTGVTVLIEGNDEGVAGVTLVGHSTHPDVARAAFGWLVAAVPPLSTAPILVDQLDGWTGAQRSMVVGDIRVTALCDATQCIVAVVPAVDLLRPLPLP